MDREDALDTDAVGDLANGKRGANPAPTLRDADTFERLESFLVTLADADVDAEGIAGAERGMLSRSHSFWVSMKGCI